jgi:hypothetical protein
VPRARLKSRERRDILALLDAPALTDVTARVAAPRTAHFRAHGAELVAYCRCLLGEGGEPVDQVRAFLLTGATVIHAPAAAAAGGPVFPVLDTFLGEPPAELATPAGAADAEAVIEMAT